MGVTHIVIIGLLLVVIYLVWPSSKDHYAVAGNSNWDYLHKPKQKCGQGLPECPDGYRCYVEPSGQGFCAVLGQKCGQDRPPCDPEKNNCQDGYCSA